jgi:hypothetical protein
MKHLRRGKRGPRRSMNDGREEIEREAETEVFTQA